MSSPAIATIVKMVESLPSDAQERLADHIRDYIAELDDEMRWNDSFKRTKTSLVAAARRAKQEITDGRSVPMDYKQL
jgi:hypothetical protein